MRAAKRPNRAQELMSMTLHSLAGAWPISRPVQRLAGIRRLERNARRWRLRISRWIYEVTGPRYALKLLRYPRRNQVAPDFSRSASIIPQMGRVVCIATPSLRLAFPRLDHHQLVLARLVPAAKLRRLPVFRRIEAGDALLEGRELDDDEAVESLRAFERLIAPAAREHLRAVLREDCGHAVRVLPVFHRIVHFRPGDPVGRHGRSFSAGSMGSIVLHLLELRARQLPVSLSSASPTGLSLISLANTHRQIKTAFSLSARNGRTRRVLAAGVCSKKGEG